MSVLRDTCEAYNRAPAPDRDFFSTVSRSCAFRVLVAFLVCTAWIIAMLFESRAGDVFTDAEVALTCVAVLVWVIAGMFLLFFGVLRVMPHIERLIGPKPSKKQ